MIVRWFYGELVVLDLSETGTQLGEKLSLLLDDKQQKELAHYLLGDMVSTIGTRKNLSNYNRQQKNPLTEIREGDLYICLEHRLVMIREQEIILTVKEFDILFFLASYPGQVFTHRQIYETVWGKEYFCDEGNVTAHIGHIRKKIELDPRNPVFIQTVRGIGYKFAKK